MLLGRDAAIRHVAREVHALGTTERRNACGPARQRGRPFPGTRTRARSASGPAARREAARCGVMGLSSALQACLALRLSASAPSAAATSKVVAGAGTVLRQSPPTHTDPFLMVVPV